MTDSETRAAILFAKEMIHPMPGYLQTLIEAAESTLPKTKTVWEVVAFEADAGAQVDSISEALRSAQLLLQNGHAVTIGKREVPV